ncbi:Tetraketide alpha-pyrone reductase 1 [Morella rubra]|uniref:Tetraketide alpha-pyrone reductase 1 n=1 Tax=Morella rubra TaxID=262757 RepID=A0A6A1VIC9_9ROSI|nr:Tetraketide alpha-pyrone reductase 1 [Morella rubra]
MCATDDPKKTQHLLALDGAKERLCLFKEDLLEEGSFDSAIDGCEGVFHTASPVLINVTDPQDLDEKNLLVWNVQSWPRIHNLQHTRVVHRYRRCAGLPDTATDTDAVNHSSLHSCTSNGARFCRWAGI